MDWPHLFSDCGPLEHPCNGIAHASDGTTIDQQAWYECDLGYVLSLPDPVVRICGEDGIWSGEAPCCDPGNSFIHRNCLIDKHLLVFIIHYPVHISRVLTTQYRSEVIQPFSCLTQLSMEFIMLINNKMPTFISMMNTTSERLEARKVIIFQHF